MISGKLTHVQFFDIFSAEISRLKSSEHKTVFALVNKIRTEASSPQAPKGNGTAEPFML